MQRLKDTLGKPITSIEEFRALWDLRNKIKSELNQAIDQKEHDQKFQELKDVNHQINRLAMKRNNEPCIDCMKCQKKCTKFD